MARNYADTDFNDYLYERERLRTEGESQVLLPIKRLYSHHLFWWFSHHIPKTYIND